MLLGLTKRDLSKIVGHPGSKWNAIETGQLSLDKALQNRLQLLYDRYESDGPKPAALLPESCDCREAIKSALEEVLHPVKFQQFVMERRLEKANAKFNRLDSIEQLYHLVIASKIVPTPEQEHYAHFSLPYNWRAYHASSLAQLRCRIAALQLEAAVLEEAILGLGL